MERRSREQWRRICAASYASGLTVPEFAARAGVNARTLSWWRSQLREEVAAPSGGAFVEVVAVEEGSEATTSSSVSIRVGDVVVEMSSLPPVEWLVDLASRC